MHRSHKLADNGNEEYSNEKRQVNVRVEWHRTPPRAYLRNQDPQKNQITTEKCAPGEAFASHRSVCAEELLDSP